MDELVSSYRQPRQEPFALVVPARPTMAGDEGVVIEHIDSTQLPHLAAELPVDALDSSCLARFPLGVEDAERREIGLLKAVDDQSGRAPPAKLAHPLLNAARDTAHGRSE